MRNTKTSSMHAVSHIEDYDKVIPDLNRELLDSLVFQDVNTANIEAICARARKAFVQYREIEAPKRARFLDSIANNIESHREIIVQTANKETALSVGRLNGECTRTTNQLKYFAEIIREGSWVNAIVNCPSPGDIGTQSDLRQMLFPLGPVAVFGASNFPLAFSTAGGDTASALASGCSVVYKAHPAHPKTSFLVANCILESAQNTQMPQGVFSMIYGESHRVGSELVENPHIAAVGFTGSLKGGRAIYDIAAKRDKPIPVFAEMGSINPMILLPGAISTNGEELAQNLVNSFTLGVGQFCTNPGVFVTITSDESDHFLDTIRLLLSEVEEGTMLTPQIRESFCHGIKNLNSIYDVETVFTQDEMKNPNITPALFKTDLKTIKSHPEILEEVFGPSTINIQVREEELGELISIFQGQLTGSIHGTLEEFEQYNTLIRKLQDKVGRLIFNGFPTGVAVNHAMMHGGPYPATSSASHTSVGRNAIYRFVRPVAFQACPEACLPDELKYDNPLSIKRLFNGNFE